MTSIATTVIVFGVLFGVAGWLASPTGSAKGTRRFMAPVLRDYPAYVYAGLAILVGIYFLSAPTQNLRSFLTTLVDRRPRRLRHPRAAPPGRTRRYPDVTIRRLFGGTRDRVVGR